FVSAVGDQNLELEQTRLGVVGRAHGLGKEELHRFAGASRDVLERGERGARSSCFDQVDGGSGDVSLAQLREAEAGFDARLLDRAWTEIDSRETTTLRLCVRRN